MDTGFSIETVVQMINSGGLIAMLVLLITWFYRGELLSRHVWEEMTSHIVKELVSQYREETTEMVEHIVAEVSQCMKCNHYEREE